MSRVADPTAKISLLRAAEEVFAERGLNAAKVEDITRRAGHSKGAFYLHFQSKEEAFKQVVESFLARVNGIFLPPSAYDSVPYEPEALAAFWLERDTELFDFLWQNRAIVAILSGCQGPYTYLMDTFRDRVRGTSREWLELSKAQHLLRPELDTDLVSTLLCGAYQELMHKMLVIPKKPPIAEWLRQSMSVFLRGLGTPRFQSALAAREHQVKEDRAVTNAAPRGATTVTKSRSRTLVRA